MSIFAGSLVVRLTLWFAWGLLTKFIDLHYDDGLFKRNAAILAAVVCGVSVGFGMASHDETFVVYSAIIAGCLLCEKIDNVGFAMSTVLVFGTIATIHVAAGVPFTLTPDNLIAWGLLTSAYVLDEKLNDAMDQRTWMASSDSRVVRWTYLFLKHRFASGVLEITAVLIGSISFFGVLHGVVFNIGYYAMYLLGKAQLARRVTAVSPA
ncbi:hypothetical protein [Sandaracinus amylolyticus]|uniref:hypothetical protein n=1 Tax=Sandaracinus amylolyticus TaxID=927083 RepID=UPI001F3F6725|nr:hypothetical protein [Sandaracinus amylolyticus]UJR84169.1 Hypothetical protein I5071_62400 [Sandaracinus amylolyticus]